MIEFRAFLDQRNPGLSVDRLDHAPLEEMTRIAEREGDELGIGFHGWFVVTAEVAEERCSVEVTAKPGNPFHADIWLPDSARDHDDERVSIAYALARAATWQERAASERP